MKPANYRIVLGWYLLASLLAVVTYFYGLDGQHIPKNGDEYPYEHIVRLTAASGDLLPLRSDLDNMRNTKPPLLFWQGIASTNWGKDWSLWNLRYPSVIYTLLTALMLFMLGKRLAGNAETGFIALLTFLAFFTTYRFGRPFLTNPPEVFWLFLPFFVLLYWKKSFESLLVVPLVLGVCVGIGFLYKSFALALPVSMALSAWYLHERKFNMSMFIRRDLFKVIVTLSVALMMFSLWFMLDPDPQAVWKEFVVGENVGKFNPHGPGYLQKLLWGGASIWSFALAFITDAGLLTFPVGSLFFVAYKRRASMSGDERLLWIWIAVLFLSFCLPSQRSGRYMLDAMPALALLCALNWGNISRRAFVATLVLSAAMLALFAYLAVRLQAGMDGTPIYGVSFWTLIAGAGMLALLALSIPSLTRPVVNVVALFVLLSLAAFLRPLDGVLGNYDTAAQRATTGKDVWVPCNFRAVDEGYRFLLPGAEIHGYSEDQSLAVSELSTRYPLFAAKVPLDFNLHEVACVGCELLGKRLDIRSRHSSDELKQMFFEGKVFQLLFIKEILVASPEGEKMIVQQSLAQTCR
ncbi:MAG: glycosyltransferase family 39 protein [Gallionella sp.]